VSDTAVDRGVDVELLIAEIEALRDAALHYAHSSGTDAVGGAGLDLETAAIRYVRKLDEEHRKASRVDYVAICEAAERANDAPGN
jgi:hypothetical protein